MKRPNNWENTQAYGDFEPLELGGHICVIKKVIETKSSTNKDMLMIYLDIAEGEQKGYYQNQFKKDPREDKKWGCIVYQLVEDDEGNTNRGLKTFINAVEKSNTGFNQNEIWNDNFEEYFKDKLIGGIFGREQYKNKTGELKWSTKCMSFRDTETIRKGVPIPEDKYLKAAPRNNTREEFEEVIDDDDLPF